VEAKMQLITNEHYDLMDAFERIYKTFRLDKENKELWTKGHIYQSGETNDLFLAFRYGASYGKAIYS
jgi:hypothetical protein